MKNKLYWLVATNYGRYILGAILALTGVFSQYGTIDFLSTDKKIFEYTCTSGIIIIVIQFLYHILGAIISNLRKK